MTLRTAWTDVPETLRRRMEDRLDAVVVEARSQANGFSPGGADRLLLDDGRRVFVKTLARSRNEDGFDLHRREARIMAAILRDVPAPRLIDCFEDGDWIALVLADIEGRHPEETGDVVPVLDALAQLPVATGELAGLPRVAEELDDDRHAWERLVRDDALVDADRWVLAHLPRLREAAARMPEAADGDRLCHVDCRADNLLIDADRRVWIIDWPWAAVGASWLDALTYLLDTLLRDPSVDVEHHLATHSVFETAEADEVDAILAGLAGTFLDRSRRPAPPSMPTIRDFQRREGEAALGWLAQRWD
jgi:aminoglycoside phosphotransferase (APT) family kinase protein